MANLQVTDGAGATKYLKGAGAGTALDPFVPSATLELTETPTQTADMTTAAAIGPAPTAGQKSVLAAIEISVGTATEVTLQEETTNTYRGSYLIGANIPVHLDFADLGGKKLATADKRWFAKTSGISVIRIVTWTRSEA